MNPEEDGRMGAKNKDPDQKWEGHLLSTVSWTFPGIL